MRKIKSKRHWLTKRLPILFACMSLLGAQSTAFADDVKPSESNINNRVTVEDDSYDVNGTVTEYDGELGDVYGGGNEWSSSDVAYNEVEINGGTVDAAIGGVAASGGSSGTASDGENYVGGVSNNQITINAGTVHGAVGGLAVINHELENVAANVTGNRVIIHGGTVTFVSGGEVAYTYSASGGAYDSLLGGATVANNAVLVDGGTITGGIIGGSALSGNALNNTIEIDGGTIRGEIIGGISDSGDVRDNVITINGAPDLIDAYLIGGRTNSGVLDGNTLRIRTTGISARNISDFQNLAFELPETTVNGVTVLELTEGTTNLAGTHMSVYVDGNAPISTHDTINLIVNRDGGINTSGSSASLADVEDGSNVKALDDMTYDGVMYRGAVGYDLDLVNNGDSFVANVGERVYPPQLIPPPIPIVMPDKGEFDNNTLDDVEQLREQSGFEIFMNNGGGHLKTKLGNGAHITNDMGTHDIGIARHFKHESSTLTFAPVFTYAYGNYSTYLPSGGQGGGNQQYAAGGVIVRSFNNSGFYYEGSVRAGRSHTKYVTNDFGLQNHPHMSYSVNATVLMGHVRVGNQWRLGKDHILDVYGYYAYARQGSSDTELNVGNHCSFSSTDSGRFRTGYRLTSRLSRISHLYTGLAFQYDTNSDAVSKVEGVATNNLSDDQNVTYGKDGASGMLEIGWLIRPLRDNPWVIDIHATGWLGMQEGVTAMAKVKRSF